MTLVSALRWAGIIEGISWLVLLFVAMPLKYGFGQPLAVRIVGSGHGFLFTVFVALLLWVHLRKRWRILQSLKVFIAALIPFGFLWVDRSLRSDPHDA